MIIRRILTTLVLTWALALPLAARGPQALQPHTTDDCLTCHDDDALKRGNGTPVTVRKAAFAASVHASMACVDCHADLARAELPHAETLARVDCAACHTDAVAAYRQSAHATARAGGNGAAATCVNCHGMHDIRAAKDPASRTYHLTVAATCAACHGNHDVIARGHIAAGDVATPFADSIHGRALSRSGLLVAPTCSDCHGPHEIRRKTDAASRVSLANTPTTCGKCHEGIAHQFGGGIHSAMLIKGNSGAPACQTCHTAHAIQKADNPEWQLTIISQCGTCHQDKLKTYRDTFHGQATNLGLRAVATCADCHGNHRILPASDAASPIAPANLTRTCGRCHANATASFVKYDPHADKRSRDRNPWLFYGAKGMQALLFGTFGFFGLHTVLWLGRALKERP